MAEHTVILTRGTAYIYFDLRQNANILIRDKAFKQSTNILTETEYVDPRESAHSFIGFGTFQRNPFDIGDSVWPIRRPIPSLIQG